MNHLHKLENDEKKKGLGIWNENRIGEICECLPPKLPPRLSIEEQGAFGVGYWHERHFRKAKGENAEEAVTESSEEERATR